MEVVQTLFPLIAALVAAGIAAGLLAGLLGVGGGIVIVPTLFFILQSIGCSASVAMQLAIGTSLLTIVPTSMSSALAHHSRGNIDMQIFRFWVIPMLFGVLMGSFVAVRIDGSYLTLLFGVMAILMALNMLFRSYAASLRELSSRTSPELSVSIDESIVSLPRKPIQALLASSIGLLCAMMGIGGGVLGVTALTTFKVPTHRAVGTSALFGLVIALPGSIMMLVASPSSFGAPLGTVGLVNIIGFVILAPLTLVVAPVGVWLGSKLSGEMLKRIFAMFLILAGLRMLSQVFGLF